MYVYPDGRLRNIDLCSVVDVLFYLLRTDYQWRYLPTDSSPTASEDGQSVDTTSSSKQRGWDHAKNISGGKRHRVVDSMGLLLAMLVTAVDVDNVKATELFGRLQGQPMGKVQRKYADTLPRPLPVTTTRPSRRTITRASC